MNLDKRLLRFARQGRVELALTIGVGFAAGVFTVLQAAALSRVIDRVFLDGQTLEQVSGLLWSLFGVILLRAGLVWAGEIAANRLALRVKRDLRRALMRHLVDLGPAYSHGEQSGELAGVAIQGIEALDAYFSQYLPQLALAALVPLTFLAFVIPIDLLSGIVLLLTAPLIPVFMILIGNLAQALTRRQWQTLSRLSAYFLDVLQGLTTLKILGRSRSQAQVIAQASDRFRQTTMGVLRVTFLSALVLEMVATLSTAVVAVQIGLRLLYGWLPFEQAFFILLLAPEFYLPLRMLGPRFHAGMSGVAAARRIFEILETPAVARKAGGGNSNYAPHNPEIRFERVSYTYEDERPALREINLTLQAGSKVAVVGPSGAGKTTLAAMLLRFITPQTGKIWVDGQPLEEIPAGVWLKRVAWVPQQPYLFHDTVANNLRMAHPNASQAEIERAAQLAHAHAFIQELPEGYETVIGERGARLSSGQAQRIAVARAFLKDAPILILDEATAHLDPALESQLRNSLDRLLEGRTALIIAHRLSTVYQADRIIVLEEGRLREEGSHQDLLEKEGLYRRMLANYVESNPARQVKPAQVWAPFERGDGLSPPSPQPEPAASSPSPRAALLRLLSFAAPFWRLILLSALAGFATIGSGVGLMAASAYIISAAALQPSVAVLQVAIVSVRFFGISRGLFRYAERYLSHQVTFHLLARLRVWFYQALEPLAPARLLGYQSGDLLARILGDIESLENFYVRVIAPPLVAAFSALAISLFLASFHLRLALALLAFLLAAGVGLPVLARLLSRLPGRQLVEQHALLSAAIVDGIQGLADLVAFGQADSQLERMDTASQRLSQAQQSMASIHGLQSALASLLANLGMAAVLVLAIPLVRSGQMDGVYLAVLTLAALTSFEAVQPLPMAAQYLENNLQAAGRLFEIADAEPEVASPPRPLPLPQVYSLEVNGLWFAYPQGKGTSRVPSPTRYALQDLAFQLPEGKRLAIVGSSGAGKSTLASLLLRFWDYSQGEIRLGGQNLRLLDPAQLRSQIAVISQSPYLFNASLRDNLLLAQPKASQEALVRAAKQAEIHDFIESLPQGYDTWIGEHGLRLSGGERQRLAIARALLKDSPLLLLDEPTANLDALTERKILASLADFMECRTTILITHRLVGLEAMDEILVLDQGQVAERGCHEELLSQNGMYRHMWEMQNQVWSTTPFQHKNVVT